MIIKDGDKITVSSEGLPEPDKWTTIVCIFIFVAGAAVGISGLLCKSTEVRTKMQTDAEIQKEALKQGATCVRTEGFEVIFRFGPASKTASMAEVVK